LRPQPDNYPQHIEASIEAFLTAGKRAGRAALQPIAYRPQVIPRRRSVPLSVRGEIFQRDRFRCRYCGSKVIPTPIMDLVGYLYPDIFPWDPGEHWKAGTTHPAFVLRSPFVDHVVPVSSTGESLDRDNLATACNPCNSIKADFSLDKLPGWKLRPIPNADWDGLTSSYPALWKKAGKPNPKRHLAWMAALGCSESP
jgi:5-methylcytosine-specific restriction endonuclease McrA